MRTEEGENPAEFRPLVGRGDETLDGSLELLDVVCAFMLLELE